MPRPLVSIIIPIYNTEKYIHRAVDSIQKQQYCEFEILLIDDGSTDDSAKVCKSLVKQDKRIRYFYQANKGAAAARNYGLREAKGEYILFCDSDDEWDGEVICNVVELFEKKDCDMIRFGFKSMKTELIADGKLVDTTLKQKDLLVDIFADKVLNINFSSCVFGAYRRNIIMENDLRFDERLVHGEDGMFVMQYLLCSNEIRLMESSYYIYYPYFEERINLTARKIKVLYNEYELCLMLFKEFWKRWNMYLTNEEKKIAYAGFIDRLIGELVRFAAYTPYSLKENLFKLKELIYDQAVSEAIKFYKRKRKEDSKVIPYFIRKKQPYLLWGCLSTRKQHYRKINGKNKLAVSIWGRDYSSDNYVI